jgi:hypothetical protein
MPPCWAAFFYPQVIHNARVLCLITHKGKLRTGAHAREFPQKKPVCNTSIFMPASSIGHGTVLAIGRQPKAGGAV